MRIVAAFLALRAGEVAAATSSIAHCILITISAPEVGHNCMYWFLQQVKEQRNAMQQQRDDQLDRSAALGGKSAAAHSGPRGSFSFRSVICQAC